MHKHIALITYLVRDYDEAIGWFRAALGFRLFEDQEMGEAKRWVVVGPDSPQGARFLLARAADAPQATSASARRGDSGQGRAESGRVASPFPLQENFDHDTTEAMRVTASSMMAGEVAMLSRT